MQVLSYTEFRENWYKEIMELELSVLITLIRVLIILPEIGIV